MVRGVVFLCVDRHCDRVQHAGPGIRRWIWVSWVVGIIAPIGAGYLGIRAAPAGQVGPGYLGIWYWVILKRSRNGRQRPALGADLARRRRKMREILVVSR